MKKSIALAGFLGIVLTSCAQTTVQSNIPSVVTNSFQKQFPNATDVEWEFDKLSTPQVYNVEFDANMNEHEAWIDAKGNIVSHKEEIRVTQVPANIKQAVKRDFPDFRIEDADKYESDGQVTYKMELDKGTFDQSGIEWKVTYDHEGKLISKVAD